VLVSIQTAPILVGDQLRGHAGTLSDITERARDEKAQRTLTAVFDATTDLVIQSDVEGQITYLNPAARRAGAGARWIPSWAKRWPSTSLQDRPAVFHGGPAESRTQRPVVWRELLLRSEPARDSRQPDGHRALRRARQGGVLLGHLPRHLRGEGQPGPAPERTDAAEPDRRPAHPGGRRRPGGALPVREPGLRPGHAGPGPDAHGGPDHPGSAGPRGLPGHQTLRGPGHGGRTREL
jgi:hypothetical protein